MGLISIIMPDGSKNEYASGIIAEQVIQDAYGRKHGCVAAKINGNEMDILTIIEEDCSIDGIDKVIFFASTNTGMNKKPINIFASFDC